MCNLARMAEAVSSGEGDPCQQTGQGIGQGKRKCEGESNSETEYGLGRRDKRAGKAPKDVCSNPSQAT